MCISYIERHISYVGVVCVTGAGTGPVHFLATNPAAPEVILFKNMPWHLYKWVSEGPFVCARIDWVPLPPPPYLTRP